MPSRKSALRFGRLTRMILLVFMAISIGAYWIGSEAESRTVFWLCVMAGTASLLTATIYALLRVKQFRCPSCGNAILNHEPTSGAGGEPIEYLCEVCDVMWDTGLRSPRRN